MSLIKNTIFMAVILSVVSCASTNLPSLTSLDKKVEIEADEQRLWKIAGEVEKHLDKSKFYYKDDAVEVYLGRIADSLFPPENFPAGMKVRVKILRSPFLNAFALPNGAIYIHTGLLARLDNEAQLATVLAHEIMHFSNRHRIKEARSAENKLTIVSSISGGPNDLGNLWILFSLSEYSRNLETEADEYGLRALAQAGYDVREAPKFFEHLKHDIEKSKSEEPIYFGTHPRIQERIDNYRRLLNTQYAGTAQKEDNIVNTLDYELIMADVIIENAFLELDRGQILDARREAERVIKKKPDHARAYFVLGESLRRSNKEDEIEAAFVAYRKALELSPAYAAPHLEMGLLYRKSKQNEKAKQEFIRYLALDEKASDAPIIRNYLKELEKP